MRAFSILLALAITCPLAFAKPDATQLAGDRVAAAAKIYTALQARADGSIDDLYRWSVRWLDAQLDGATGKTISQALADHQKRMLDLETATTKTYEQGLKGSLDVVMVNYYRIEADLWVARGKK